MICCLCRSQLVGEGFDAVRHEQRVARFRTATVGRDPGAIACKQGSYALRAESKAPRPTPLCFCLKGVGVRLADDGARSGPDTRRPGSSGIPRVQDLLPLRGRSLASQTSAARVKSLANKFAPTREPMEQ